MQKVSTISLADVLNMSSHAGKGPRMMKMDIEGSEFTVLKDLLSKRLLCKGTLDLVTIEWHDEILAEFVPKDAQTVKAAVLQQTPTLTCDPTVFVNIDDESYLHDGQPVPEVPEQAKARFKTASGSLAASADMFKGCHAIYYDVGANLGTHIRKLFEPTKYPDSPMLEVFDEVFGPGVQRSKPSNLTGLCAFGFEASPQHAPRLADLEATYNAAGWRVKFFVPVLVSDKGGEIKDFYFNGEQDKESWGASIFSTGHH